MAQRKNALKAEAVEDASPRSFTFNGATYEIPHPDDWPVDVLEAYQDGKAVIAVREMLGEEQWNSYKAREKPRVRDLQAFLEVMFAEVAGVSEGE